MMNSSICLLVSQASEQINASVKDFSSFKPQFTLSIEKVEESCSQINFRKHDSCERDQAGVSRRQGG